MSFIDFFGNKVRARDVVCSNGNSLEISKEWQRLDINCGGFKTITVDNGVEFSDAEGLEKSRRNKKKRTKVYYCHPYSSCERGSNENANRLIRRHIPKGVNFDKKSKTEIKEIETWINNYPRKIFEYDTAENQFINEMEKLTG